MKKYLFMGLIGISLLTSCATSYTTVATPQSTKQVVITSGDMPTRPYTVLGFVESAASEMGFGLPTESKISAMKTKALNSGLVTKAEELGADAVINVSFNSASKSAYVVFLQTDIFVRGCAIKFTK